MESCHSELLEIMSKDRFRDVSKDKWDALDNGKFRCPRCKYEFSVDTWLGVPYWKYCPMCGKEKEVNLL